MSAGFASGWRRAPGREGAGSETPLPWRSGNGLGQAEFAAPSPERKGF